MSSPDLSEWLRRDPFTVTAAEKGRALTRTLTELTEWHVANCPRYATLLRVLGFPTEDYRDVGDIPFIPARLFKEFDLLSIDRSDVFKTMTSSGTSGQQVSRIFLNRETASNQTRILSKIVGSILGKKRVPMLVVDSPGTLKDRLQFSARGAGILGFSMFGTDVTYALNDDMSLNLPEVSAFLDRHRDQDIFVFGFTFVIWQHFVQALAETNSVLDMPRAILLHGGGWKKLQESAVSGSVFRSELKRVANIGVVHDYYGMVEQTGSIFLECGHGHLHAPAYADVVIRDMETFEPRAVGQQGVVEVLSVIPGSYPGHAILTEDLGTLRGEDDCPCGWMGKHFTVAGRLAKAEVRGCSDTYEIPV